MLEPTMGTTQSSTVRRLSLVIGKAALDIVSQSRKLSSEPPRNPPVINSEVFSSGVMCAGVYAVVKLLEVKRSLPFLK